MTIGIASDHAGFSFKTRIKLILEQKHVAYIDYGCFSGEESVDYPDYIKLAAEAVINQAVDRSIVICGSGIGASIVANKVPGIRAALCHTEEITRLSRLHNDANVLALGGRFVPESILESMIEIFLTTSFEGDRHTLRIKKIYDLENTYRTRS